MKPFQYIIKHTKTQKEALEACKSLIDYFCGLSEAKWVIECMKKEKRAGKGPK